MVAMYPPDTTFPVYCRECWYGDGWDAADYGRDFDPSRPFFEQLKELFEIVPRLGLFQINPVNSPFANGLLDSKNVYLAYSVLKSENVMYSKSIDKSTWVLDSMESVALEQCYENLNSEKNYNSHFLTLSWSCIDSWFLYDCANCKHCVMSSNLRNREYVIRNTQYSKEDYFKELEKMNIGSARSLEALREEFAGVRKSALHKYANILKSTNTTGHHVANAKNAIQCFELYGVENTKYCYRVIDLKDCRDTCFNGWSELVYEHVSGGTHSFNVRFSGYQIDNIRNSEYVYSCNSISNAFGCIGLKKKEYCILNKRYSSEEYEKLRETIIKNMKDMPHVDAHGRSWSYGEFFPINFAEPFGYNETNAQELFPLTKDEALARGYAWKDMAAKDHAITKMPADLPDEIGDVDDGILKEAIGCAHGGTCDQQCTFAFRVTPDELQFYRQKGLPLPRLCPNCRHYERVSTMEPLRLWRRQCLCAGTRSEVGEWENRAPHAHGDARCRNEFESPYAPERREVVYCEQCYQAEIV
jgi:hypothetical protein